MKPTWPKVRLGEVLHQRGPDVTIEPTETYRFAGVYSFGRGVFRAQTRRGSEFAYQSLTRLRKGEFVYPKLMAWEGAFGVVPAECDGCHVSPEFPVFEIDTARLVPSFLGFYFQIPRVWESMAGRSTGTNVRRRRLHPADFLRREIPLPSLAEQRRLVARIEELAARINEARALRQQASGSAETLLVAVAHGRNPDHTEAHPAGWRRMRLGECIRLVDHSQRVSPDQRYPNLGIYSFGRGLFPKPPIDGAATSARTLRRVTAGQFIYSRLFAFEGAYGMVTEKYDGHFVSGEYPTFECDPGLIRVEFLTAYFKAPSVWSDVSIGSKGLGNRRQRVQPEQLLRHPLWVPPLAWQDQLAKLQVEIANLKNLQTESSVSLDALLPAVLDRAFRGDL